MDLKTLILLLENKIKTKDFILPYNSKSLDSTTIQNLNQNLSQENLEKIISDILKQNVSNFKWPVIEQNKTNAAIETITGINSTNSEPLTTNTKQLFQNINNVSSTTFANEYSIKSPELISNVVEETLSENGGKNILLFNFLMFSNKQVLEYVKMFSLSNSTDFYTITTSYNQLINFLGYYKISSFFLEGIDEFHIILNYFKKDLSNAYYTFLHVDYNSGLNQLVASNKIISQIDYLEVIDNLEKSNQEFLNENEKILEKSNNEINNLISQKRQRKIILSGLLMLGSYIILAKTGIPFISLTKFLFSTSPEKFYTPLQHFSGDVNLFEGTDSSSSSSREYTNIRPQLGSENNSDSSNIRFRDLYDLALKILYKKLKNI